MASREMAVVIPVANPAGAVIVKKPAIGVAYAQNVKNAKDMAVTVVPVFVKVRLVEVAHQDMELLSLMETYHIGPSRVQVISL